MKSMRILMKAVTEYYKTDPCTPSVTCSWLGDVWYVSICRYTKKYGDGKVVVCKTTGRNLKQCICVLSGMFLTVTGYGPAIRELIQSRELPAPSVPTPDTRVLNMLTLTNWVLLIGQALA